MVFFSLFFILSAFAQFDEILVNGGPYTTVDRRVNVTWQLYSTSEIITFTVIAEETGWVGIALSETGLMTNSDFLVVLNKESGPEFSDRFANSDNSHSAPVTDEELGGKNDILNATFARYQGKMFIQMSRYFNTKDQFDIFVADKSMYLLIAYGSLDSHEEMIYHASNRVSHPTNFYSIYSYEALNGNLKVRWFSYQNISDFVNYINFRVDAQTNGWVAIGVSKSASMAASDFMIAKLLDDEYLEISDRVSNSQYSSGRSEPVSDVSQGGTDDVNLIEYKVSSLRNDVMVNFTRKLDTKDEYDIRIKGEEMFLLYAVGTINPDGTLEYHQLNKGVIQVNFLTGKIGPSKNYILLWQVHGSFMTVAM